MRPVDVNKVRLEVSKRVELVQAGTMLSTVYGEIQSPAFNLYHSDVVFLAEDWLKLAVAIRKHRDTRGDDRCWDDDEQLYKALPEGYTPPERDTAVELTLCQKFIASRQHPRTTYVSPQRRIEELEAELARVRQFCDPTGEE